MGVLEGSSARLSPTGGPEYFIRDCLGGADLLQATAFLSFYLPGKPRTGVILFWLG